MNHIDRRRVLTSFAAGTAMASASSVIPKVALAAPETDTFQQSPEYCDGWLLAQQQRDSAESTIVDFWSMPWAEIRYAKYLPPQIRRGLVSYEQFPRRAEAQNAIGAYKDGDENRYGWLDLRRLERFIADSDGRQPFVPLLDSFLGADSAAGRTCLMALDSSSMSCASPWEHILPAFRGHYESIVGIKHFANRGLCQQRAFYQRNLRKGYFDCDFMRPVSLCDATIVTSEGLIETDAGLCSRATTEELAGELVRRLGHALLDPTIRDRIVGTRTPGSRPRLFALGSATINAPAPLSNLESILYRQNAFVSASFGPLAGLPLFIVTSTERGADLPIGTLPAGIIDVFSRMHGYPIEPVAIDEVQAPYYQPGARDWPGALDLIALWPFKLEHASLDTETLG